MRESIQSFLNHLRVEKQSSPHTLRSYEDDLAVFDRFVTETFGDGAAPSTLDSQRLRRYSAWLSGQGYASSTVVPVGMS